MWEETYRVRRRKARKRETVREGRRQAGDSERRRKETGSETLTDGGIGEGGKERGTKEGG